MSSELERRTEDLETRLAFQELTIEQLSEELAEQQRTVEKMRQQMDLVISKLREQAGSPVASQAEETPPPHY